MEYILVWIACGFFAATVASSKGRGFGGWFFLGLLFGPIALLAVGFMPKEDTVQTSPPSLQLQNTRKCPFCAEDIKIEAIVCKHCGHDVEPLDICLKCNTPKGLGTCEVCDQARMALGYDSAKKSGNPVCNVCHSALGDGHCKACIKEKNYQIALQKNQKVCESCRDILGHGDCDRCKKFKIEEENSEKKIKLMSNVLLIIVALFVVSIFAFVFFFKETQDKQETASVPAEEKIAYAEPVTIEAVSAYEKLAEGGDVKAQIALGRAYIYGNKLLTSDLKDRMAKGYAWYKKAADQGNKTALYEYGRACYEGMDIKKDISEGVLLLEQSAAQGYAPAIKFIDQINAQKYIELGEFNVKLSGKNKDSFIMASFTADLNEGVIPVEIIKESKTIHNTVTALLREKTLKSLEAPQQKLALSNEILKSINKKIGKDVIKGVHYTDLHFY